MEKLSSMKSGPWCQKLCGPLLFIEHSRELKASKEACPMKTAPTDLSVMIPSPWGLDPYQPQSLHFKSGLCSTAWEAPGNCYLLFAGSRDPLCWPPRKFKISKAPKEPRTPLGQWPQFSFQMLKPHCCWPAVIPLIRGHLRGVKFPLRKQSPLNWKSWSWAPAKPCLIPKGVLGPFKPFTADCPPVLHFSTSLGALNSVLGRRTQQNKPTKLSISPSVLFRGRPFRLTGWRYASFLLPSKTGNSIWDRTDPGL